MKPIESTDAGFEASNQLLELAWEFRSSRVFLSAYQLGVFTALGAEGKTSREVAETIGADHRATDRLLNALVVLGLLRKQSGRFSNTPLTERFLVQGRPDYLEGIGHFVYLWENWSNLTESVRTGTPAATAAQQEASDVWRKSFIAAMHDLARRRADRVMRRIDLSNVSRVLDLGAGSGEYAMAFVRARDGIRATAFDTPDVIPLLMQYVEREGLSRRIEPRAGDFFEDPLGEDYDLVFLSAIIHIYSPPRNQRLFRRIHEALSPGGRLVVHDFIMDEDRSGPLTGALFALNMLVATEAGDTYTESEVRDWMEQAGLSNVRREDTGVGTSLISGQRPS
jgi:SAM-dependent methyltransferase